MKEHNKNEMLSELLKIKSHNGNGGLGIEQTAGALKIMLMGKKDIHVVYHKEICGIKEIDNEIIASEIEKILFQPKQIVFPYAINEQHQISVVINTESSEMIVTDSLGIDRSHDVGLRKLCERLGYNKVIKGISNYQDQPNTATSWECGVHAVHNSLDLINGIKEASKKTLELDNNLETIVVKWLEHRILVEVEQTKNERNRKEKADLLVAIELIRNKEGNFNNTSAHDDLKFLADRLQIEGWGNLNRVTPDSNRGRDQTQAQEIREREIEKLIEEYEKKHQNDILGIVILNVLKRGGEYEGVIEYHRKSSENYSQLPRNNPDYGGKEEGINNLCEVFIIFGKYDKALECAEEILEICRKNYGDKDSRTINAISNLGLIYKKLEKYDEAEKYYKKALEIFNATQTSSLNIGVTISNLSTLYHELGKFSEALQLIKDLLRIYDEDLPAVFSKHKYYADALINLSSVYNSLGNNSEAIKSLIKALDIYKESDFKADIALANNALGRSYFLLGQYDMALGHFFTALEIYKSFYGEEYLKCAETLNSISNVYIDFGDFGEADKHLNRALEIYKKSSPREGSDQALVYNNMGNIYRLSDKYSESEKYHKKALNVRQAIFGNEHSEVADSMFNLAEIYRVQGRYGIAKDYHDSALKIKWKIYGLLHTNVALSINALGYLNYDLQAYQMSFEYHLIAHAVYNKMYNGVEHINIAMALEGMGNCCYELKNYNESLKYHKQALDIRKKVVGESHYSVAMSIANLGNIHYRLKDYDKSLNCHLEALKEKEQNNAAPSSIAASYTNIANVYYSLEQYDKALEHEKKALKIKQELYGPDHIKISEALGNISETYITLKYYQEAVEALERALKICNKYEKKTGNKPRNVGLMEESLQKVKTMSSKEYTDRVAKTNLQAALLGSSMVREVNISSHLTSTAEAVLAIHTPVGANIVEAPQIHDKKLMDRINHRTEERGH